MPVIYKPKGRAGEYAQWAANLYKGCTHKCVYCLEERSLVLMDDWSVKPIILLEPGDHIVGVEKSIGSRYLKYTPSVVEAVWTTEKLVWEIELSDGTVTKCSGDHRWLTNRGWKHTVGAIGGKGQRPHLTRNNCIRSIGSANLTPDITPLYEIGYIAGITLGDGTVGEWGPYPRSNRKDEMQYSFNLRLKDQEPLDRTKAYLGNLGIQVHCFKYTPSMNGIRTGARETVNKIKSLLTLRDDPEFLRGFIAGIYDAEGCLSGSLRISNSDWDILDMCEKAFTSQGFKFTYDVPHKSPNTIVQSLRLLGGRNEFARFFQWSDPAIKRKRQLFGSTLKHSKRVVDVRPTGKTETLFDIQTTTENFVANTLVSHNCYAARVLRMDQDEYNNHPVPKKNVLDRLEQDARRMDKQGNHVDVLLSFVCDDYQPLDAETGITRSTIEILHEYGHTCTILTKGGTRALRDIDLLTPKDTFACTLTCLTVADSLRWEPGAATPQDRLVALSEFHQAGIPTWVSIEPVINPKWSLDLIETTYHMVSKYKVGKLNYEGALPDHLKEEVRGIDWRKFGLDAKALLEKYGKDHYIKEDLAKLL